MYKKLIKHKKYIQHLSKVLYYLPIIYSQIGLDWLPEIHGNQLYVVERLARTSQLIEVVVHSNGQCGQDVQIPKYGSPFWLPKSVVGNKISKFQNYVQELQNF